MPEDPKKPKEPEKDPKDPSGKEPDDKNVPYERFKDVNDQKKAAEQKAAEYEQRLEEMKRKQAEENEEYKSLWEQEEAKRKEYEQRAKEWDQYQADRREALKSQLTDDDAKEIADSINDLTKLEKFVQIQMTSGPENNDKTHAGKVSKLMQSKGIQTLSDAAYALTQKKISQEQYDEIVNDIKRNKEV